MTLTHERADRDPWHEVVEAVRRRGESALLHQLDQSAAVLDAAAIADLSRSPLRAG